MAIKSISEAISNLGKACRPHFGISNKHSSNQDRFLSWNVQFRNRHKEFHQVSENKLDTYGVHSYAQTWKSNLPGKATPFIKRCNSSFELNGACVRGAFNGIHQTCRLPFYNFHPLNSSESATTCKGIHYVQPVYITGRRFTRKCLLSTRGNDVCRSEVLPIAVRVNIHQSKVADMKRVCTYKVRWHFLNGRFQYVYFILVQWSVCISKIE